MTKESKRPSKGLLALPEFKSREEEAEWFDRNRDRLVNIVFKYGQVTAPRRVATKQLTMRIPVADIEQAQAIAAKQDVGYQTVLKQAIRAGLKRAGLTIAGSFSRPRNCVRNGLPPFCVEHIPAGQWPTAPQRVSPGCDFCVGGNCLSECGR